jgi:hypothetical protein
MQAEDSPADGQGRRVEDSIVKIEAMQRTKGAHRTISGNEEYNVSENYSFC